MQATVKWVDGMMFLGESGSGHTVVMDGAPDHGGRNMGVRPMEMLLLGLGLRQFSVPPSAIPEIKRVCRSVSLPQCEEVARRALQLYTAREIDTYVREELRKVAPELLR